MFTPSASAPVLRIAIYRASSLGDMVLATACLDLLRQLPIKTEVTWIGRGPALETIATAWPTVKTITVNRSDSLVELQKIIEQISNSHLFIDLQCNLRSNWLARNLKAIHKVPFFSAEKAQLARNRLIFEARVRGRRRPLPERARIPTRLQYDTMADALKRGLRHHLPVEMRDGMDHMTCRPALPVPADFDPPWRKELRFGMWLAVAPGAAHPTKQAPLETIYGILDQVRTSLTAKSGLHQMPLGLVFLGDSKDRHAARHLLDQLDWQGPVLNLAGRLSLWETAVALSEANCLLSNDSSLGHIAESVETPTAVLFGPTIESFGFAPRMPESRAFSSLIGCRPCSKHGKVTCRFGDKLCFSTLKLAEISDHLIALLQKPKNRHSAALPTRHLGGWMSPQFNSELGG